MVFFAAEVKSLEVCTGRAGPGRAWFSPRKKRAGPGRAGPGLAGLIAPGRAGPTIELTKTGRAGPGLVTDGPGLKKWARADLYLKLKKILACLCHGCRIRPIHSSFCALSRN
jgi:hypothetical protein